MKINNSKSMQFAKYLIVFVLITNIFAISRVKKAEKTALRSQAKTSAKTAYSRGEESSNIAFNGNWWNDNVKIYLREVDGPTSWGHVRGIVFNNNYNRNNLVKWTDGGKTYYYLPYRNLNGITCNAWGSNRAVTSDGTTTYDIWLDVWESECNTISNYLDTNRRNRQTTLSQVAKDLSTYCGDYVTNLATYNTLNTAGSDLKGTLATLDTNLKSTNDDITKKTKLSTDTAKSIADEEKVLSTQISVSTNLQSQIDSNNDQVTQIKASIESLTKQGTGKAIKKELYISAATTAQTNFNVYVDALKAEVLVGDANLFNTLGDKLKAFDNEGIKFITTSFLPN
jgi:hypothetical protein